jgi:flagellar hook-associated protein 3 FlgL
MIRISNMAQSQLLVSELMKANQRNVTTEMQVSSGKKGQYFKDYADQTSVLFSAKRVLDRNAHYTQTVTELQQRLDTQNLNLTGLEDAAGNLRQAVTDAIGNSSGLSLMDQLNSVFQSSVSMLNTQVNGQYLYGGTRTDTPPVNITSLSQLSAASPLSSIFSNNDQVPSAVIGDGIKVDYGFTASDLGTGVMSALQTIKNFNDNIPAGVNPDGPFGEHLTDAQKNFLEGQLANLKQVASDATAVSAQNGLMQQQVDDQQKTLSNTKVAADSFVSDIEDADLPTALTNLQQDQLALQAASKMVAEIGQMSLLNFLPAS